MDQYEIFRHEFIQPVDLVIVDAIEDISEIGQRVTIIDATIVAETRRKRSRSLLLFECQASISIKRPFRLFVHI